MQGDVDGGEGGEHSVKRHVKQNFPAHWSSICCMLRRVLEQQKALLECVGKEKTAVVLSSTKWNLIAGLVALLQLLEWPSGKSATISHCLARQCQDSAVYMDLQISWGLVWNKRGINFQGRMCISERDGIILSPKNIWRTAAFKYEPWHFPFLFPLSCQANCSQSFILHLLLTAKGLDLYWTPVCGCCKEQRGQNRLCVSCAPDA